MDAKKHLDTQLNQLMSANILQCMCAPTPPPVLIVQIPTPAWHVPTSPHCVASPASQLTCST